MIKTPTLTSFVGRWRPRTSRASSLFSCCSLIFRCTRPIEHFLHRSYGSYANRRATHDTSAVSRHALSLHARIVKQVSARQQADWIYNGFKTYSTINGCARLVHKYSRVQQFSSSCLFGNASTCVQVHDALHCFGPWQDNRRSISLPNLLQ